MRFEQLDLIQYGGFENRSILFPQAAHDLHIIHGANEAGKSTTLAAIRDFLFGFSKSVSADWKTPAPQLRVGARLTHDTQVFQGIRRKATNRTLFEPDDATPLDGTPLERWLLGMNAQAFEANWSLDHTRLRQGGEEMRELRDDAGLQLLSAGLGISGLKGLMKTLEDDMAIHWKKRSTKGLATQAKKRLADLTAQVGKSPTSMPALTAAQARQNDCDATLSALSHDYATLDASRLKNERILRNFLHIQEYEKLLALTENLTTSPLSTLDCDKAESILDSLSKISFLERSLADDVKTRAQAVQDIGDPPAILARAQDIEAVLQQSRQIEDFRSSLIACRNRISIDEIWLAQFWSRHAAPHQTLPENIPFSQFQSRLEQRAAIQSRHDHLSQALAAKLQNDPRHEAPTPASDLMPDPDLRAFESYVQTQLKKTALDAELCAIRLKIGHETGQVERALQALLPWVWNRDESPADALSQLILPDQTTRDIVAQSWHQQEGHIAQCRTHIRDIDQQTERAEQEIAKLRTDGRAISLDDILDIRDRRDQALAKIWTEATPDDSTREAVRLLVADADRLADIRYEHAGQSARLSALQDEITRLRLEQKHAKERLADSIGILEATQKNWRRQLPASLGPLTPNEFTGWLSRYHSAKDAMARLSELKDDAGKKAAERLQIRESLSRFLTCAPENTIEEWLERASAEIAHHKALHQQQSEHARAVHHHDHEMTELKTEFASIQEQLAQWHEDWASLCREFSFPGKDRAEDVQDVQQALNTQIRLQEEYRRRDDLTRKIEHVEHVSQDICEAFGAASLAVLSDTLENARQLSIDIGQRRTALSDARKRQDAALSEMRDLTAALAIFFERTGTETDDDLRVAIKQARLSNDLMAQQSEKKSIILENGNGYPLETLLAEVRDRGMDELEREKSYIAAELLDLQERRDIAKKSSWEARQAVERIETGHGAADLAEDIAATEAQLAESAEAYVSLKLQSMILQRLVEQRRHHAYGPLLTLAGQLFSQLTLNAYDRLVLMDDTHDQMVLAGRKVADGTLVSVEHMSEGTRDQLYLALRLATVEQAIDRGIRLPFLADDLFITFDETRAEAGLRVLSELSTRTQVIFFTHHGFLAEKAAIFAPRLAF